MGSHKEQSGDQITTLLDSMDDVEETVKEMSDVVKALNPDSR